VTSCHLRNKIAHELDFDISDNAVMDLTNCTPKQMRDATMAMASRPIGPLQFHELLRVVLLQAEVFRQKSAKRASA
jgi:hypothetical protein